MENKNKIYHFGTCAFENTNKIIVCEESKRKFIVNNKTRKEIIKVYIDKPKDKSINCKGLNIVGNRCDYLVIEKDNRIANFIELKGQHVNDAIKQLSNSIKIISNPANKFIDNKFSKINSYAVTSKVPKNVNIANVKKMFRRNLSSTFEIKNNIIKKVI